MTLSDDLTYEPVHDDPDAADPVYATYALLASNPCAEPEFDLGEPRAVRSHTRERRRRAHRDWQARDRARRGGNTRPGWDPMW